MKKILIAALLLLVFSAAGGVFGQDVDELLKKGLEYLNKGDYANAITEYSSIIERYNHVDAYWNRGRSYQSTGNLDAAIADFNITIARVPNFATAYMFRGDTYGMKGIYSRSINDYRQGLEKGYDINRIFVNKSNKADMWFCGMIYMDIVVNKFLGDSAAIEKNEAWLKTVCDNSGVTRTEIEAYYRDNIGSLVSEIVDEEFGKIRFIMDKEMGVSYNAVLIVNPQTEAYTLTYERPSLNNDDKAISAASLPELLALMRGNTADFDQNCINVVEDQAYWIPAQLYAQITIGGVKGVEAITLIKKSITDFYVNPGPATLDIVFGIDARYSTLAVSREDMLARAASDALHRTMFSLCGALGDYMFNGSLRNYVADAKIPNDRRFDIFSARSDNLRR